MMHNPSQSRALADASAILFDFYIPVQQLAEIEAMGAEVGA